MEPTTVCCEKCETGFFVRQGHWNAKKLITLIFSVWGVLQININDRINNFYLIAYVSKTHKILLSSQLDWKHVHYGHGRNIGPAQEQVKSLSWEMLLPVRPLQWFTFSKLGKVFVLFVHLFDTINGKFN